MEKPVLIFDTVFFSKEWQRSFSTFSCSSIATHSRQQPLIRWGSPLGGDSLKCTLNRKRPLLNTLDRKMTLQFLKLNRIRRPEIVVPQPTSKFPVVGKSLNLRQPNRDILVNNYAELPNSQADFYVQYIHTIKDYKTWVFDAKVFHMEKRIPVKSNTSFLKLSEMKYFEPIPVNLDADSEKAAHLAIKAVHITGLDFAQVRVGIDQRNRPVILDLKPVLEYQTDVSRKFIKLLKDYLLKQEHRPAKSQHRLKLPSTQVLLGADPEFVLHNQLTGGMVYPSSFLTKEGLFGYDERSEGRKGVLFPLAEVRPPPDPCPLKLTEKIKSALEHGLKKIPYKNIEWLAGSIHFNRYQIGGHIHYSGIELSSALLRALDNYLGLIVSMIENHEASAQRRRQYGGLGNFRIKPHGGFEYRTLGSWLVSPEITKAVLCLAKVVALEYPRLKRDFFVSFELQQAFYQADRSLFYELFPLLWDDLKNTFTFKKYESELKVIYDMINKGQQWNEQLDIRKTWGLPIPTKILNDPTN